MRSIDVDEWHPLDGGKPDKYIPLTWTPEYVATRLIEAYEILSQNREDIFPKGHSNSWPNYLREFSDMVGICTEIEVNSKADFRGQKQATTKVSKCQFSSLDISKMEEALYWPIKYLGYDTAASKILITWANCVARGISFNRVIHRQNWSKATIFRKKKNALNHLSLCLNRDNVPVR